MCGIAGFIRMQQSEELCKNADRYQAHRGPDHRGYWLEGQVALSHQRLSIIDLDSRSNQPFVKDGLVIVFNGEIYNYKELRHELQGRFPDLRFDTGSDTEVLLELYREKKENCLDDLIGMFAFAIYEIDTGKLFIARDHFGIKPLFYTQIGNQFAFSSELKTLVSLPGFDKTIHFPSLVAAISYLWVPGHASMFRNTFKLPPAHYMTVDTRAEQLSYEIKAYWTPSTESMPRSEASAVEMLRSLLERSVERHMVADVPVSSFLSGGLDSSLLSVLAQKKNPRLSTYTIATAAADKKAEQMPDDEKYARRLAEQFNFDHHEIVLQADVVNALPRIVYALDEPIGDPAAINTYLICKAAKEKGVRVLLSGMGADELFFGYRRQKATLMAERYKKIPAWMRSAIRTIAARVPVKSGDKGIRLVRWVHRFLSFADLPLEEAYRRSYSYYDESELAQLFLDPVAGAVEGIKEQHSGYFNRHYPADPINKMCFTDIHLFMNGLNLTYSDRASMAASVEVRVPFIDKEMVSFALQTPGALKYKKKTSKYILKKAAESYLPKDIIYRPKASFGAPLRSWISKDLRSLVDDLLSEEAVRRRGLFNAGYVRQLIDEDRAGKADHAYRIYQLLTLEQWFRIFVDEGGMDNPNFVTNN